MQLAEITKLAGRHKKRRRVGRGPGCGKGKTCGRGHKGAGSRSGWRTRGMAEGGQMPLFRRLPKRGFNNAEFARRYHIVNIGDLEDRFEAGAHVTDALLISAGLIDIKRGADRKRGVKVLGNGELTKPLTVEAARFSQQAAAKIEAAGGEARVIGTSRSRA